MQTIEDLCCTVMVYTPKTWNDGMHAKTWEYDILQNIGWRDAAKKWGDLMSLQHLIIPCFCRISLSRLCSIPCHSSIPCPCSCSIPSSKVFDASHYSCLDSIRSSSHDLVASYYWSHTLKLLEALL